jgi:hypothetical protein
MDCVVYETGRKVFLTRKFVVMLECFLMRLLIIAVECVPVPDGATSKSRKNFFMRPSIVARKMCR